MSKFCYSNFEGCFLQICFESKKKKFPLPNEHDMEMEIYFWILLCYICCFFFVALNFRCIAHHSIEFNSIKQKSVKENESKIGLENFRFDFLGQNENLIEEEFCHLSIINMIFIGMSFIFLSLKGNFFSFHFILSFFFF